MFLETGHLRYMGVIVCSEKVGGGVSAQYGI